MSDIAQQFAPGDSAEWLSREGDAVTKRVVRVESVGPSDAIVCWGLRADGDGKGEPYRFNVPIRELRRPPGPEPMPWGLKPIVPPRPSPPPTSADLDTRLASRRDALRAARDRAAAARETVDAARDLADRAQREADAARAELARANAADAAKADAFAEAIRRGERPVYSNGIDHDALRRAVEVAESAQRRFDAELASATAKLTEAASAVRAAAAAVLATVVERETECLRDMETRAAALRARLSAAAEIWLSNDGALRLDHAAASYLAERPAVPQDVGGFEARAAAKAAEAAPFKRLHERLVAGEVEAEEER